MFGLVSYYSQDLPMWIWCIMMMMMMMTRLHDELEFVVAVESGKSRVSLQVPVLPLSSNWWFPSSDCSDDDIQDCIQLGSKKLLMVSMRSHFTWTDFRMLPHRCLSAIKLIRLMDSFMTRMKTKAMAHILD